MVPQVVPQKLGLLGRHSGVQEMLGHASIALTMDTYSHVLPGMQDESAARLNALLDGAHRRSDHI